LGNVGYLQGGKHTTAQCADFTQEGDEAGCFGDEATWDHPNVGGFRMFRWFGQSIYPSIYIYSFKIFHIYIIIYAYK
jgi:hypothetical protein